MNAEHKSLHSNDLMVNHFPITLSYQIRKMTSGISSIPGSSSALAVSKLKLIGRCFLGFYRDLHARGKLSGFIKYDLEISFSAIQEVHDYFTDSKSQLDEPEARIRILYIREEIKSFRKIAEMIDKGLYKSS